MEASPFQGASSPQKITFELGTEHLRPQNDRGQPSGNPVFTKHFADVDSGSKGRIMIKVDRDLEVGAIYRPNDDYEAGGVVKVHTAPEGGFKKEDFDSWDNQIAAFTHELQHAKDDSGQNRMKAFRSKDDTLRRTEQMHSEFRAWAMEAAVSTVAKLLGRGVVRNQDLLISSYQDVNAFTDRYSYAFQRTGMYLQEYKLAEVKGDSVPPEEVARFLDKHKNWIAEACIMYQQHSQPPKE